MKINRSFGIFTVCLSSEFWSNHRRKTKTKFFFNRFQQIFYYHHHHSKKKLKKFFKHTHTHTYIVTGVMITIWHMMTDDDTQLITPITFFLVTFRYMARNVNIQNTHNMRHTSTHAIYKKKVFSISGSSSNNHAFIGRY